MRKGGPEKGRRPLCDREGLAHSRPRDWDPFFLRRWATLFCVFFTPKTSCRLIRAQLLDPFFTNLLYWARSKNQDPTIGAVCGKNSCASENDNQTWWDQTPKKQAPISLSQLDPNSRVISQTLNMAGMKKTEGFGKGV